MRWVGVTHVRRHHEHDHKRGVGHLDQGAARAALSLSAFTPLADLPGAQLVSLRQGTGSEQLTGHGERLGVLDLTGRLADFADTTALMSNFDLVITADVDSWGMKRWPRQWTWLCSTITRGGCLRRSSSAVGSCACIPGTSAHCTCWACSPTGRAAAIRRSSTSGALRLNPRYAEAHNSLGMALAKQGKLEDAVTCYKQALLLKPDFAEAHNNLANVDRKQRKVEEAVAGYQRALALRPGYAEAHYNLAVALYEQKRFAEAVDCFEKALSLKPDYADAYSGLGVARYEQRPGRIRGLARDRHSPCA